MKGRILAVSMAVLLLSTLAAAQAADTPYQVRYAANLDVNDSFVNITNTGASSTVAFPQQNGALCANVYAFNPAGQMISCCGCYVPPDGLVSLSVRNDIWPGTSFPTSLTVKIMATSQGAATSAANCAASPGTVGTGPNVLATGLTAWMTTTHSNQTETAFTPSTLSAAELTVLDNVCATHLTNHIGVCRCEPGGR